MHQLCLFPSPSVGESPPADEDGLSLFERCRHDDLLKASQKILVVRREEPGDPRVFQQLRQVAADDHQVEKILPHKSLRVGEVRAVVPPASGWLTAGSSARLTMCEKLCYRFDRASTVPGGWKARLHDAAKNLAVL